MGRILQNGILTYEENGKIGAIDTKGKIIVAPIYTYLDGFSAEHLSVAVKIIDDVEKYGVINSSGNTVVPFIYDFIRIEEREKKIAVYKKYNINEEYGRVGFLSYTGAEILPTEYSSLTSAVTEKLYYGKNITKDVYQVIDLQKKSITNVPSGRLIELYYLLNHSESLVSFAVKDCRFNLYGFKDIKGNLIIPAKYIDDVNFINGLAAARTGDFEIVWMDTFGNQVKADSVQQKFGSLHSDNFTLFKLIKDLYEN